MTDPKAPNDPNEATTPEDVATLYSWANLHGAKYRDFSASRAQAREEARLRVEEAEAAERKRQEEEAQRKAQEEAQIAARLAAEAAEAARQAEAERIAEIARQAEAERQAVLAAQEAQRQAALQRSWQPAAPETYQTEFRSAPASNSIFQSPPPSAAQPSEPVAPSATTFQNHPGAGSTPSSPATPSYQNSPYPPLGAAPSQPTAYHAEETRVSRPPSTAPQQQFSGSAWAVPESREAQEMASRPAWLAPQMPEPAAAQKLADYSQVKQTGPAPWQIPAQPRQLSQPPAASQSVEPHAQEPYAAQPPAQNYPPQYTSPYGQGTPPSYATNAPLPPANPAVNDTLAGSRERVANRWYALKSVFDPQAAPVEQQPQQPPARVPVLAVFSLAGGVGKTSLVASLGRALSARGERVLLVDTAAYGLLPFFFGARDQRPGQLRTFSPPGASVDAPIQLVTLDPESAPAEVPPLPVNQGPNQSLQQVLHAVQNQAAQSQDWLAQEVTRYSRGVNRILIDLPTASGSTTRRILRMGPVVLVPVAPDMSSVVSVGAIESFFRHNAVNANAKPVMPYYVLNQFDYSLPLHLDVREILREQIGDRLLPFALRRSPAVSEALAEGMTVMDYAPNATVAEDYAHLAEWVRSLSAPATQTYRGVRWSER